jgi:hypothetical protein
MAVRCLTNADACKAIGTDGGALSGLAQPPIRERLRWLIDHACEDCVLSLRDKAAQLGALDLVHHESSRRSANRGARPVIRPPRRVAVAAVRFH